MARPECLYTQISRYFTVCVFLEMTKVLIPEVDLKMYCKRSSCSLKVKCLNNSVNCNRVPLRVCVCVWLDVCLNV